MPTLRELLPKSGGKASPEPADSEGISPEPIASGSAQARWTFLTNHSHVLIILSQEPTLVLREVARRVGITERAVQRIITELEESGYLTREKVGRQNRYGIRRDQPLRHPIESRKTIGDLLEMIIDEGEH